MAKTYYVLLGRDIFTKDHAHWVDPRDPTIGGTATVPPPTTYTASAPPSPAGSMDIAESAIALMGVASDDGKFVAFVEDLSAVKTNLYKVGDPIARGKIKQIELDHLDYERASGVQRVEIGQNFNGQVASVVGAPSVPIYSAGSPTPPPAAPSTGGAPPVASPGAPSAGGADAVLEAMRQRRLRENGGKP